MIELPANWVPHLLIDLIERLESGVSVNAENISVSDGTPGVLKVSCVSGGAFYPEENKRIHAEEIQRAKITAQKGAIIISRSNTRQLVGECGLVKDNHPNLFLSDKLWQTIFRDGSQVDARWLKYFLTMPSTRRKLAEMSNGTSGSMKNISKEDFLALEVMLPPPAEQRTIADALDQWDCAIEKLEQLITAKTRLKRGLMQQLLTGRKRFKEFEGQVWVEREFGVFLKESRVPGSDGKRARKLTVKLYGNGVIEKRDKLEGSANTKYYVRKAGQFIYSKLDFLNGAFGIIPAHLDGYESTLDLPAFEIADGFDGQWLLYHVTRSHFYKNYANTAEGGRKARRVQPEEFLKTKVRCPSLPEQRCIASVLNACDSEIDLLKRQLAALKKQKQGLMQQLLTGRIRVHEAQP
ncbi:MAG: restriction endonuclease subunit S [Acidobacteria bacterium]|nr:restriction endonuclease subunit S [Acidobacteriota bacterium]